MAETEPYDKGRLLKFKREYYFSGKYNLAIQVPHLARLADYYQWKYNTTKNWTDCLRAHALFNSCATRRVDDPEPWRELAFSIQSAYHDGKTTITYNEQRELTNSLKSELESIRSDSRYKIQKADELAQHFKVANDGNGELIPKFVETVRGTSISCTDKLIDLSRRIMLECVGMQADEPPCTFNVLAIGSLARGEATPYSDLEYLFLVEKNSPDITAYFERLAMTSYFIIGNFGETKLSHMGIKELDGWFDDKAINGFKIDGIAEGAGNIPTGNGSTTMKNHFILTPEELCARYEQELTNPVRDKAIRGDMTSMLNYMKLVYVHSSSTKSLLADMKLHGLERGFERLSVNEEMLKHDLEKFNFSPSSKLQDCGFTVDVKRSLYRFPSILLLDLSVIWDIAGDSAWKTAELFLTYGRISEKFYTDLVFILASACFIRLSTYLYHNSHDDRLSVAEKSSKKLIDKPASTAEKRWFVPIGLFSAVCERMIPMKKTLETFDPQQEESLSTQEADKSHQLLVRMQTLYSCGRYSEALRVLENLYGKDLYSSPQAVLDTIKADPTHRLESLTLVADVLVKCSHYRQSLAFSLHVFGKNDSLESVKRLADCYDGLSQFKAALGVLNRTKLDSGEIDLRLGDLHLKMENYNGAEEFLVSALEKFCIKAAMEQKFDYYGNPMSAPVLDKAVHSEISSLSPLERLRRIPNATTDIADAISSLQYFYYCQGRYDVAEQYNNRYTELLSELYGQEALVISVVAALCKVGNSLFKKNKGPKAEELYLKSLEMCREIYGPNSNHSDIATLLSNLGYCYGRMEQYVTAREYHEKSLNMLKALYGEKAHHVSIAEQICEIGWSFNQTKHYLRAESELLNALEHYRKIYGKESNHIEIAGVLTKLGVNYSNREQHAKAEEHYEQALIMYRMKYGSQNHKLCIASVLLNLGYGKKTIRQYQDAEKRFEEALAMYREFYGAEDHLDIANTLIHIGDNYKEARKYKQADDIYSRALVMYRTIFEAENNPKCVAKTLRNHGTRYKEMREFGRADGYFQESLEIYKTVYGTDETDEKIAVVYLSIGYNYEEMDKRNEAESSYMKALNIYTKMFSTDTTNSGIADTYNRLGLNCTEKEEYDRSEEYLTQSMNDYYRIYGIDADHEDIAIVLNNYGYNYNGMGEHLKAEQYLLKSLAMRKRLHGENNDHEEIADVLYNMGYNYVDMKEYEKAENTLFTALKMYKVLYGNDANHGNIAKTLNDIGTTYTEWGKYDKAGSYYEQSIEMEREINGADYDAEILAKSFVNLGHNHQRMKELKDALRSFEEGLQMYIRVNGESHISVAECCRHMGQNYEDMKLYKEAESYYTRGIDTIRQLPVSKISTKCLADILDCLGLSLCAQDEDARAEKCLKESLSLYKELHGTGAIHDNIAGVLSNLAYNYNTREKYKEAEDCYLEALSMRRSLYGQESNHEKIGLVLSNLGRNYNDLKQYESAEKYLQQSLTLHKALHGSDANHTDIAYVLYALGTTYKNARDYNKADVYYSSSLTMYRHLHADDGDTKSLAGDLKQHGNSYKDMEEYAKADKYLNEALGIYFEIHGEGTNKDSADTLCCIGQNCYEMNSYAEAEAYFTASLEMYRELNEKYAEFLKDVARLLERVGLAHSDQGEHLQGDECFKESLILYRQVHGEDANNSSIASLLYHTGYNYHYMGDFKKANQLMEESLRMREILHGTDANHEEMAFIYYNLANNYVDLKMFVKAEDYYNKALSMYKEMHGHDVDHEDIAKIYNDLGATCTDWGKYDQAVGYYDKSLEMRRRLYGEYTVSIALTLFNLYQTHLRQRDHVKARQRAQESLDIYHLVDPANDSVTDLYDFLLND